MTVLADAPPARSSSAETDLPDLPDVRALLEGLRESCLLIRVHDGYVLWRVMSPGLAEHALARCTHLTELDTLWRAVSDGCLRPDRKGATLRWDAGLPGGRAWCVRVHGAGDSERVWVRLSTVSDRDDYYRRYVAEREKLFTTSRTISVGEMASTLAHELNQPIGTLVNLTNGLRSRLSRARGNVDGLAADELEELDRALEMAQRQGRFASDIIARIRDFTQARRPRLVLCRVGELLGDTVQLLDWVLVSRRVIVHQRPSDPALVVEVDRTLMQQVLANVMRNAAEAMSGAPDERTRRLDLCAEAGADGIELSIADRGDGLDQGAHDRLFTPFASSKPDGMGIGLNICRSLVELHRGRFWLTGNECGGCTAHILLPIPSESASDGSGTEAGDPGTDTVR